MTRIRDLNQTRVNDTFKREESAAAVLGISSSDSDEDDDIFDKKPKMTKSTGKNSIAQFITSNECKKTRNNSSEDSAAVRSVRNTCSEKCNKGSNRRNTP